MHEQDNGTGDLGKIKTEITAVENTQSVIKITLELIRQSHYPGDLAAKVASSLNWLEFMHRDMDARLATLKKIIPQQSPASEKEAVL